jgi:hypothetical protein
MLFTWAPTVPLLQKYSIPAATLIKSTIVVLRGNEYLPNCFDYGSNSILHCALKKQNGSRDRTRMDRHSWYDDLAINQNLQSPTWLIRGSQGMLQKYGLVYQRPNPSTKMLLRAIQTYKRSLSLAILST